jgi:hypothetical protein
VHQLWEGTENVSGEEPSVNLKVSSTLRPVTWIMSTVALQTCYRVLVGVYTGIFSAEDEMPFAIWQTHLKD